MFGFEEFSDEQSADLLVDLAIVRHVVVHRGAWPQEADAAAIKEEGVIVPSRQAGGTVFYELKLINKLLPRALFAFRETARYHNRQFSSDPSWSL